MKKRIIYLPFLAVIVFTGCKKDDAVAPDETFNTLQTTVITDFVNKVALPGYAELQVKATTLNTAVTNLNTTSTEDNLTAAKLAWKDLRKTWERCEGFLFGPIEDNNYDPQTDTWPVDFNQMDSLLISTNPLGITDIEALPVLALRGYHPLEYILWGEGGTRTAASLNAKQKTYMVSLSQDIKNQVDALNNNWAVSGDNYANVVLTAGTSSNTLFPTKQSFYLQIAQALKDICGEVGEGKMKEPYDLAASNATAGAQAVESPFSGNSVIDFKNNIVGAYNVYLGKFNDDGAGLNDLVRSKNLSLDNELQQKFNAAISAFDNITVPYEQAISTQRVQCQQVMTAIDDLAETIETKLDPFIIQYIVD